jgi:radical SAM superfamily enzyme YgiQ (UPF0313 family)
MKKSVNRLDEYGAILENLREAGIFVYGTFVFGYPHDTPELYGKTVRFAIDSKMLIAAFNHLVPFPGTPLYAELEDRGRLRYDRWWLSPDYYFGQVPYNPERVSAEQVELSCLEARRAFYSLPSILKRALDSRCNGASPARILTYVQMNRMLRQEVNEKRGVRLGFPGESE